MSEQRSRPGLRRETEARTAAAIAGAAALAGALAGAEPTGTPGVDQLLTAGFAALVTLAASRSKRWPLLAPVAAGVLAARGLVLLPAVASAVPAVLGARERRRSRLWGALAGGLSIQALLRLPDLGFHGASALLVAVAVAPVLVSGYQTARRRERRVIRRVGYALGGIVVLVGLAYAVLLGTAYGDLDEGAAQARVGLAATRNGDTEAARAAFARSRDAFGQADERLGGPLALPARLVPVLSQHATAVSTAAEQGTALSEAAGVAVETDYQDIRSSSGRFDLDLIRSAAAPLRTTADAIARARERIGDDTGPWLVAPLADEVDELAAELDDASDEAELAAEAVDLAPELLGGDGPRRYLVVFVTPVELRGSGGFIGSFAEVDVDQGRLQLGRTGSSTELITRDRDQVQLTGVDEYVDRYGGFAAGSDFRDLTFSPHFPYDGEVIAQAYPQLGGSEVDGVISVDPISLAALLELTGPIEAPLFGRTLTAADAAEFLLRDNYTQFADPEAQNAALSELVRLTFESLTTGDLPGPRTVADVLSPSSRDGRIRLWSPDPAEQALFARIGADGAFPEPRPGHDFLAIASQNASNNKLDYYLRRDIGYSVDVADDGSLQATATVTLHNDTPLDGSVPDYVLVNRYGDPPGTNHVRLTVYSPHALDGLTVDGEPVGITSGREAGYRAYTVLVAVPPGGSATVELTLVGSLALDGDYVLDLAPQPTVTSDRLGLDVTVGGSEPLTRDPVPITGRRRIVVDR